MNKAEIEQELKEMNAYKTSGIVGHSFAAIKIDMLIDLCQTALKLWELAEAYKELIKRLDKTDYTGTIALRSRIAELTGEVSEGGR